MQRWFVSKPAGFTQIELMITVAVVGILAAIALPNLTPWFRQQQVNAALNQIDLALQQTQTEAVKRHRDCRLTLVRGSNTLTGTCLGSGTQTLNGVVLNHSRSGDEWTISFNADGENRSVTNDPGTLWLSAPGAARSKCLVISVGIGLRRTGQYGSNVCTTS